MTVTRQFSVILNWKDRDRSEVAEIEAASPEDAERQAIEETLEDELDADDDGNLLPYDVEAVRDNLWSVEAIDGPLVSFTVMVDLPWSNGTVVEEVEARNADLAAHEVLTRLVEDHVVGDCFCNGDVRRVVVVRGRPE